MSKEEPEQIIEMTKVIFKDNNEIFSDVTYSHTNDNLIIHIVIPIEKLKTTTIRIVIPNQLLNNVIEVIKTKLTILINSKIKEARILFKELRLIKKGHRTWLL